MKKNFPVTGKEVRVPEGVEIISTTDTKGIITDCNDVFVAVSGFSREELIGKSHNIVRHPDVPPAAFGDLWATIKAGRPWMGIVKNRCKNGDHYWVDAYVTPIFESGQISGYESVRVTPTRDRVEVAEQLYAAVNKKGFSLPRIQLGLRGRLVVLMSSALAAVLGAWLWNSPDQTVFALLSVAVAWALSVFAIYRLTSDMQKAVVEARAVIDNPLLQLMYTDSLGDIGGLRLAQMMMKAQVRTMLSRAQHLAHELNELTISNAEIAHRASTEVVEQRVRTEKVAESTERLSVSFAEVAHRAADASEAVRQASEQANHGRKLLDDTCAVVSSVDQVMVKAEDVIRLLDEDANTIGSVTSVIQAIAEQTNLLALNAAIEAARAGESGRGFAVVADEVRSLATRTAESTQEIRDIIDSLQTRAREAVSVMEDGKARANDGVHQTRNVSQALDEILGRIRQLSEMNEAIATASEEQSQVVMDMTNNIHSLKELGAGSEADARESAAQSDGLHVLAEQLESMVVRFRG